MYSEVVELTASLVVVRLEVQARKSEPASRTPHVSLAYLSLAIHDLFICSSTLVGFKYLPDLTRDDAS